MSARTEVGLDFPQEVDQKRIYEQARSSANISRIPSQARRITALAAQAALNQRGVAVIIVNGDMFPEKATTSMPWSVHRPKPGAAALPTKNSTQLAGMLERGRNGHDLCRHRRARRA